MQVGVIIFTLPAVVEILELLVAVVHFGLRVFPQKKRGAVIGARVQNVRHQQRTAGQTPVVVAHARQPSRTRTIVRGATTFVRRQAR